MRIFRSEYDLIIDVLEKEIMIYEEELAEIDRMVKDPAYIYMTRDVSWKHIEPVERKLKPLYILREKLMSGVAIDILGKR